MKKDLEVNMENFAEMFEKSISGMERLEPGQQIETEIITISGSTIFLQLSGKSEGVLDIEELLDKEGNCTVKEGELLKVYFLEAKNGEMRFTTRISGEKAGKAMLESAHDNGIPVEGVVEKEIKGGFEVKIGGSRAFCPYSQMGQRRVENAEEYVGQHLTFKIMEYGENGRNILVSNRMILEEEHQKTVAELRKTLKEGAKVTGTVMSLQKFGAFVELGGVQALLPISEVSRSRVDDLSKVLSVGQEITAIVLSIDWKNEKISLSMKALEADPWETVSKKYPEGSKHTGTIARITDFGAFITLEPGLDGLVHVSELKEDPRENNPQNKLIQGDKYAVQINSIDTKNKRISLRPASKAAAEESIQQYIDNDSDSDTETYNPFAALLKDKVKKEKKK